MMKTILLLVLILGMLSGTTILAQSSQRVSPEKRYSLGSSMFVLLTPVVDPSPEFLQLNFGYRLTKRDVLSLETITWAYHGPLGRPYGPDFDNEESNFPGKVKAYGAGLAYQRFLWKGLYSQIHATAFHQDFLDTGDKKIQSGFQLFTVLRLGYHIDLFNNRFFIEPSVACTSWPVNTNLPESFQVEEDQWNSYFLFEPGLHFGIRF